MLLLLSFLAVLCPAAWAQRPAVSPPARFEQLARKADEARAAEHLDQATRLYREALKLKPGWPEGWWALGTIAYDADRYAECTLAFRRFTALKPDAGPGQAFLGLCECGARDYNAALKHLFRAQKLGTGGSEEVHRVVLYQTAVALNMTGNFERAIEQLRLLIRNGAVNDKVRAAAALAVLRRAATPEDVPPADRDLVTKLGDAVTAQLERRPQDAMRAYASVLASYPKTPEIHYAYGAMLVDADADKGLAMLKQELELNPQHVPALVSIALEYLRRADLAAAEPYAQRAVQAGPDNFVARTTYGRVLAGLKQVGPAIVQLEAAVRLAPDSPAAHFALANAYAEAGRRADAARERKEFTRLRKLMDSSGK